MQRIIALMIVVLAASCKHTDDSKDSQLAYAFSADAAESNIAILWAADRWDVQQGARADIGTYYKILTDVMGEYGFKVYYGTGATENLVSQRVAVRAAEASRGGTIYISLSGHNNVQGEIWGVDGSFIGFKTIVNAIRKGRNGKPVKRLVLSVSGCYSGSWIDTVNSNSGVGAYDELLVMTSSPREYQSGLDTAGFNFVKAQGRLFNAMKNVTKYKYVLNDYIYNLGQRTNEIGTTPQFLTIPNRMRKEPLFTYGIDAFEDGLIANPDKACTIDLIPNRNGTVGCSIWNLEDVKQKKAVFTWIDPARNPNRVCTLDFVRSQVGEFRYGEILDHCEGSVQPRTIAPTQPSAQ